jgi:hypothetical protein
MVDRLKSATEHLKAPGCPNCHIEMRWFSSQLVIDDPEPYVEHRFICPNCQRAERVQTELTPIRVRPDKLSAPRFVAAAA